MTRQMRAACPRRCAIEWILGILPLFFIVGTARGGIANEVPDPDESNIAASSAAAASLATDVIVSSDSSISAPSITSPAFTTLAPRELLIAFVATDASSGGMTVTGVTGAGLTWALVRRTNAQLGTAEIWRAFAPTPLSGARVRASLSQSVAASITVVSFTGADTTGTNGSGAIGATAGANANPGAPSATLVTSRNHGWVWGVGNDWDHAIARAVPSDQSMVHQAFSSAGDTWWVQRMGSTTPTPGTSVTINDTAPATDRYNLSIVELLPAAIAAPGFSVSGSVAPAAPGSGTLLTLSGRASASTTANVSGNYGFAGLPSGAYTITPTKTGVAFSPLSRSFTVNGANVQNLDFTATLTGPALDYPDLTDIIPASGIAVVGTGSSRVFQYTHLTFNGGPGPLVIQPIYSPTSGNYQGIQRVYSFTAGDWALMEQTPVAGAFVFHAVHGHFHYPFASYGLYSVAADGSVGDPVVLSSKIGFCIADSYLYDPTLPHAGDLGTLGSCSDPTSLRGLDIGCVDEYDRTDDGQSISLDGVPDGTYWLRALVDPDNFLAESNENNNETDVKLTITGNTVQVLENITPVLPPLPSIALTSPLDGATVQGITNLTASTPVTTGVQFLLDGLAVGGIVTGPPYVFPWNSATVPNGTHWLAVQTTDSNRRTNTSAIASVTVSNGPAQDTSPPTVQVADPEPGDTVYAIVAMGATAQDQSAITSLQFYVDGVPEGAPLSAPPYLVYWNSTEVPDGAHTVSASATDAVGLVGYSPPVGVIVDNSRPPDPIGKEVELSVNGAGVLTTPTFSTTTPNDLLLAFVAYDGPSSAPQTATVTGAGLTWTLLKRSNVQHGTAEIWTARPSGLLDNVTVSGQPGSGAYTGSLTVTAFTHALGTGVVGQTSAPSGPPDIFLPGVAAGSWAFAVGNDWDGAIPRTPVAGQVLVHEWVEVASGTTYWVQSTLAPSTAFALVDIHDTNPTTDQWNYAAVEIVATRSSQNTGPVARAEAAPRSGAAPLPVNFSGATSDANGDSLTFGWTFGDGGTASGRLASHTFAAAGDYAAILTVDDGRGGTDTASVAISVSAAVPAFPQTAVLDDFNRANGPVGSNWIDQTTRYTVGANALVPTTGDNFIEWNPTSFGPNQEAFVTLGAVAGGTAEHNLMLKTQGTTWSTGHIEVSYVPSLNRVNVNTFTPPGSWSPRGTIAGVTFVAGDQLGARALGDGTVRVYKNGALLGSVSVATWAYAGLGGRIGLSVANAATSRFDDFGGGNAPATAALLDPPPLAQQAHSSLEPPRALWLSNAFPNPTNGRMELTLALPTENDVSLSILDIQGREVFRAAPERAGPGRRSLGWDGRGGQGPVGSGVYLARVRVGEQTFLRRFAMIR